MFILRYKNSFLWAFCLFLIVCPGWLFAQFRVGPKLGFQMGRAVYTDEAFRQEYTSAFRPGMQIGGVMNYRVTPVYSLHAELYFSQKGKRSKSRDQTVDQVKNTALYNYIDLPVMLRLSKHKNYKKYKVEYFLNLGPSINYWLGGRGTMESPGLHEFYDKYKVPYKVSFKDNGLPNEVVVSKANRIQMSLDFGGGVLFDLGTGKAIMVELRNSIGIGKTYMGERPNPDDPLYDLHENFESVNHVFGLTVAYLIDIDMTALLQKGRIRR